jgi:hypothetical protein
LLFSTLGDQGTLKELKSKVVRVNKVNMVQLSCTMYENGKMRPIETIPGMGEEDEGE